MTMRHHGGPGQPHPTGRPLGGPLPPIDRGSFTDRVMARVAAEPTPSPARVFFRSLGHLAVRDALAALLTAWRLAFEPASPVSVGSRASAAALFLSVVIFVGLGGAAVTSGTLALLRSDGPAPVQLAPGASPLTAPVVVASPSLSPLPSPTPSATPSPSPRPTAEPASLRQRERATPTPTRKPQGTSDDAKSTEKADREKRETPEPEERDRESGDD
jgi:hypothetical protein